MVCPGRPDLQTDELLLWAWTEQESHACKHHWFWVVNISSITVLCINFEHLREHSFNKLIGVFSSLCKYVLTYT